MNYRVWVLLLLWWMPGWALAGSCTVLIVGDSLSSGYGLAAGKSWVDLLDVRLKKAAPPQKNQQWRVINASVSGDTTQNGLQRLQPALERHHPQGVLIALGGNDALRGTPPAVIRQN
ncbi:MAG: GDSL-type esterase/lipase family protein, partial [Thiobacillus sp.]